MPTRKLNPLAEADNHKLFAEICIWIDENIDADIGWKEVYAKIDSGEISYNLENAKINPRFLHFFVDESRMSLPWWMELSTWHEFHSLVEGFDKLTGYWGEFADPKILLSLFETALMPENFSDDDSEDRSYFENAIDFLREVVEQ